jgi:CTP:molybdopterin cytidylyltransferase MocA
MTTNVSQDLPILILAAGQSSRMRGRDKLLEEIDGVPLLRRQVDMACAAALGPVFVTVPEAPHPRHDILSTTGITTVVVPDATIGMSASLRRGLAALPDTTTAVMILLADLPDLTTHDLRCVAQAVVVHPSKRIWRGATADGAPGHPIVFARALFPALKGLSGDQGGAAVVRDHSDDVHLVHLPADHARRDLDTPEDWGRWRAERQN